MEYSNILIIQTAFIGDAILASSLAEKLHAHFPESQISLLVRKGNESIYQQHPFISEVLVWDKKEKKLRNLASTILRVRAKKFDCVINCHRFASSGLITMLSGARHTSGYKENPFSFSFNRAIRHRTDRGEHEVERYTQLVEDFTDARVFHPRLYPRPEAIEKVRKIQTASYVCMAPASVWATKQLPLAKWVELCNGINHFTHIFLLGAPGDGKLCEEIKKNSVHPSITVLAGELSLLESASLMQSAAMNYVNDSAPLHLASSVNAPVTAFFCSTVPGFGFGPLSENSTVREVKNLPCRPCGLHGYKVCPLGHFKCGHSMELKGIT